MTVLITGARGKVGRGVLSGLRAAGGSVRASSRDASQLDLPAEVPTVDLDLTAPATFAPALAGITDVFLYAEPAHMAEFLDTATEAGVQRIVLLSSSSVVGANADASSLANHHLGVERAIAESGLRYTFLRPDAFASNTLGWAYGIKADGAVDLPYPTAAVASIHEADIADVAVTVLGTDAHDGATPWLTGPESITFAEQVAAISAATGLAIQLREQTEAQAREQLGRFMSAGYVDSLLSYWASSVGHPATVTDAVTAITGKPGRIFQQWATDNRAVFLPA